jgi:ribosome-binding factor A
MTGHRAFRLNEQLKREISAILSRKVRDPRVGHVLVTEARVSGDFSVARVFFRVLDDARDPHQVQAGLEAAAPFVRMELGKVLRIRRVPELRFEYDQTLDSASRIEEVLREVLPEEDTEVGEGEDVRGEGRVHSAGDGTGSEEAE